MKANWTQIGVGYCGLGPTAQRGIPRGRRSCQKLGVSSDHLDSTYTQTSLPDSAHFPTDFGGGILKAARWPPFDELRRHHGRRRAATVCVQVRSSITHRHLGKSRRPTENDTCKKTMLASRVLVENEKEPVMLSEVFALPALSWRLAPVDAGFAGQFPGIGSGFPLRGHRFRLSSHHAIVQAF